MSQAVSSSAVKTTPVSALTSRYYQSEQDLLDMQDMLMEARQRTSDWRYAHIGELLFNFFMVLIHLDPQQHVRLWHTAQGKLVGFAMLGEDPSLDFQVLPEYEWIGIEREAYAWAESRLVELRERNPQLWGGQLVSGARQDDARRISFLEQHGFRYRGEFAEVNMLRSLDELIPDYALPAGCQVRELAVEGEIPDRAAAEREVWQPWTVGNITDEDYARFMQLPGYHRELDVVAVTPGGVIAAYVMGWIDPLNRIGDFGPVGARAEYRRQGFTRAALLEGLHRMQAYGMDRVCISTGLQNTTARRLYNSIGFVDDNQYLDYIQSA